MKVVDMFGAGIPVLAIHYKTIHELVKNGENGYVFKTTEELAQQIKAIAKDKKSLTKLS
jgi:beta-1,4-mannosyltransferase